MSVVSRWLANLRGGGFRQTQNRLRDKVGFCCLGVACDQHSSETGLGYWEFESESPRGDYGPGYAYVVVDENGNEVERRRDVLPQAVQDWLGLKSSDGTYSVEGYDGYTGTLAEDNDSCHTFTYIADLIEKNPDHLFKS